MAGLDRAITKNFDYQQSLDRIKYDVNSDFIFAPHLNYIYQNAGNFLAEMVRQELNSGTFKFDLPLLIGVPKASGLTRPGAILFPKDRLLYQILADNMIDQLEQNIDRERVLSNVPSYNAKMFSSSGESYKKFQELIHIKCEHYEYCIKTDVASFFETIYQHFLINQINSTNVNKGLTNLLEKALLAWREDKSYGILQGLFPSDLFGNYYLTQIDYNLKLHDFDYVRYVDDIYIFSNSEYELKKALIWICDTLRQQGLFLNESKTIFAKSSVISSQEIEFEELFQKITFMLDNLTKQGFEDFSNIGYGFQTDWDVEEDGIDITLIDGFRLDVIEELYEQKHLAKYQRDSIIKFCLPLLSKARSRIPLLTIKDDIRNYPHLVRVYASYLATIDKDDDSITTILEEIIFENHFVFEYQQMWLFSVLLYRDTISEKMVKFCAKYFLNKQVHESIRAICVIVLTQKGKGHEKKLLRDEYNNENSPYVKCAILYSSRYREKNERNACKLAWGTNNYLNELMVEALKR